jgi:hypothetical protein
MRYLDAAQITNVLHASLLQVGGVSNSKVCVPMSLRPQSLARFFDKIAPALILVVGSSVAAAFANVAGI